MPSLTIPFLIILLWQDVPRPRGWQIRRPEPVCAESLQSLTAENARLRADNERLAQLAGDWFSQVMDDQRELRQRVQQLERDKYQLLADLGRMYPEGYAPLREQYGKEHQDRVTCEALLAEFYDGPRPRQP